MQTLKKPRKKTRLTGAERRRQIVRIASELFARKGFRGTTTREIAREAGISEAVIYRHFSRKENLYRAIINDRCDDAAGQPRLMRTIEGRHGRDFFHAVARFMIEENTKDPSFMRLITFSALEESPLTDIFVRDRALELNRAVEDEIRRLMDDGEFRDNLEPELAARAFLGMVIHFVTSQELYGLKKYSGFPTEEAARTFVDIFFDGSTRR